MSGQEDKSLTSYVICPVCGEAVISSETDSESMICNMCVQRATMKREHAVAREKARKAFREMIKDARPNAILAPHISEVCAGVVRELGGLERFCEEIVEDYRDARERAPGSATVIRFGETMLRLVRDSSALRETAPDAVNLTEDEILSEMMGMMENAIQKKGLVKAEQNMIDLFLGDITDGRKDDKEAGGTSPGTPESPDGGTSMLPPDE